MPLPCFIRGDDVEFGLRLHMLGIPTVSLPGVAVWHEPFYLKLGNWQAYYETRNLLIAASLHLAPSRMGAVRRIGRLLVMNLLTFRYYTAALILAATEDYLRGPQQMHDHPAKLHASLAAFRTTYPSQTTPRETVLEPQILRRSPRSRLGCIALLTRLMVRNGVARTVPAPARSLDVSKLDWLTMQGVEHIAIESWWDDELPTVSRSREHHRTLVRRAITVLYQLHRGLPAAAAAWRADTPLLTSQSFWRKYLGISACNANEKIEPAANPIVVNA
jgi:galactofuranosylgalactofuranosylrhamnosyl-N-acetylglucosaminyl-diphospho-decaprenol beta-1,5/1,6-galactofuranosyltransferase